MSSQAAVARTPGAKRAGPGEHIFDLATVNKLKGGPDYSSVEGSIVEGDKMTIKGKSPDVEKYGKATPEALVESAVWEAGLFEEHDFHDFKISVKHNDPVVMVRAY